MAEATVEKKPVNWIAWVLGIGGSITVAGLLWIVQFLAFGFEEYVKDVAAQGTVPAATQTQIDSIETAVTTMLTQAAAEAELNREFRREQQEDMRNLVQIMANRRP